MIVGIVSPYNLFPPNSGGKVRIFQIVKNLGELGYSVKLFIPDERENIPELKNVEVCWSEELNSIRKWHSTSLHGVKVLTKSLIKLIKRVRGYKEVDVIQSELLLTALHGLVLKNVLHKRVVLDEHNVETILWYRINRVKRCHWRRVWLFEQAVCRRFDHITVTSELDKCLIQRLFSIDPSKITVIPNGVDPGFFTPNAVDRAKIRLKYRLGDRPVILFLGRLSWFPNTDAAHVIVSKILPDLKRLIPDVVMMFVGVNPPPWLLSLKSPEFIVTGAVDDVRPYINAADVCIAPIRCGSGTRLKILEYMACEKAVVTTSIGVEGLDVTNGRHVIIEDNLTQFASRIAHLIKDRDTMLKLGKDARRLVLNRYDWKVIVRKVAAVYRRL